MQVVVDWFQTNLGFLPPQLLVTLVSMLPLIELRGGIPLARLLMLPLWQALLFSAIGNILPIPFILFFIEKIFDWLRPTKHFGGIVKKLEARALGKSDGIQKAEFLGLTLFVGNRRMDGSSHCVASQDRQEEGLSGHSARHCTCIDDHVFHFLRRVRDVIKIAAVHSPGWDNDCPRRI